MSLPHNNRNKTQFASAVANSKLLIAVSMIQHAVQKVMVSDMSLTIFQNTYDLSKSTLS